MPGTSNVERAAGDPPEPVSEEQQSKMDELRRHLADAERERDEMATATEPASGFVAVLGEDGVLRTPEEHVEAAAPWQVTRIAEVSDSHVTIDVKQVQMPPMSDEERNAALAMLGDGPNLALAELLEVEPPDGWDNGADPDDVPDASGADADRALELMELENDRARIDLEREKLAHARLVASDELRVVALQTARSVINDHKFMTATDRANALEAQYRRILGLLEEPDPANGPQPSGDGRIDRTPGDVRLYDHVEQRPV